MNAKIFSYKVTGIVLEPLNEQLKLSPPFDRKAILAPLRERFEAENYKIDEGALSYKLIDEQLFIQGVAVENEAPKSVGFQFGKA
ncbi:hypothetical protein AB6735_03460 [Mucilaginibacter sp. RCC_168]|uniref:hypothetical protein n=1 Tax=Mucilaginibacter sp. RCC_168 TaxID=3239221 RepID=UPI00352681C5